MRLDNLLEELEKYRGQGRDVFVDIGMVIRDIRRIEPDNENDEGSPIYISHYWTIRLNYESRLFYSWELKYKNKP